jgi:hypothetical protein
MSIKADYAPRALMRHLRPPAAPAAAPATASFHIGMGFSPSLARYSFVLSYTANRVNEYVLFRSFDNKKQVRGALDLKESE